MNKSMRYSPEVRERVVRLVVEHQGSMSQLRPKYRSGPSVYQHGLHRRSHIARSGVIMHHASGQNTSKRLSKNRGRFLMSSI